MEGTLSPYQLPNSLHYLGMQGGARMARKRCGACLTGWDLMGWVGQKEVKGSLTGVSRVELESHGYLTG